MKQKFTLALFCLAFAGTLSAQNVGIGTAAPVDKLHVAGAANSIRIEGLSSTGTYVGTGIPLRAVFVDANGSLVKGGAGATFTDAWYTIGNAGTTAGTNFIGTTDAQAFVTKTGGSAAANERMRILATGPGVFNATTPFAGDVFSVYGTGYAGATNALGDFVINGYVGADGTALYGESNSAAANAGIAVWGNLLGTSTPAAVTSYGSLGRNTTVPAATGIAVGTGGIATATSGDARGVNASTASAAGIGVAGFNTAATGANAYGVYGQTASTSGVGIFGINASAALATNTGVGVFGRSTGTLTSGFSIGVRGYADAATGNGHAFYGQALSAAAIGGITFVTSTGAGWQGQNAGTGDGVRGINTNATAATAGAGVYGATNATAAMGGEFANLNVLGTGLLAVGNNLGGNYLARGSGLAASGTQFGVVGFATTMVNTNPLNNAPFNAANASAGGYFEVQNAGTAVAWSYVGVREVAGAAGLRKIIGNGTVNTIVKDLKGDLVALSCPEAPENLFQDYGQGQLVNGKAHITIDPIFAKNIAVNEKHPLRVFIQLEGDCNGVYVSNKTQNGFDVIELAGGTSNTSFSWSIVANRADEVLSDGTVAKYSTERFAPAPGPQEKQTVQNRKNVVEEPLKDISSEKLPQPIKDIDKVK